MTDPSSPAARADAKTDAKAADNAADNADAKAADKTAYDADAIIAGGGMIGLTLALALARSGLVCVVVDAMPPAAALSDAHDGRNAALAAASVRMLRTLGLWDEIEPHAQPILEIVVSDGRLNRGPSPFFMGFDHRETGGGAPLGWLVENRWTRRALHRAAAEAAEITMIAPARLDRVVADSHGVSAKLPDGRVLRAPVALACDGRESRLRAAAGIDTIDWRYNQDGIVCTVAHDQPHHGIAQEYFLPSGPFAILPLPGRKSSLVWTERPDLAKTLTALDDAMFDAEVARRFGRWLGATRVVGPRWRYPLRFTLARDYVAPRFALVGDAAHAVHPIAGQGLNLGFRDVAALAEILVETARLGLDIGGPTALEEYRRWRRFDNAAMGLGFDALNRLFSNDYRPVRALRDVGAALVSAATPLRRGFMATASGAAGALPRLMRGEAL